MRLNGKTKNCQKIRIAHCAKHGVSMDLRAVAAAEAAKDGVEWDDGLTEWVERLCRDVMVSTLLSEARARVPNTFSTVPRPLNKEALLHVLRDNESYTYNILKSHEYQLSLDCPKRDRLWFLGSTVGDGNCLFTSVSAGLALLRWTETVVPDFWYRDMGSLRKKGELLPFASFPDPSRSDQILRGSTLRLDVIQYYLDGFDAAPEDTELASRRDTIIAVASMSEPPDVVDATAAAGSEPKCTVSSSLSDLLAASASSTL